MRAGRRIIPHMQAALLGLFVLPPPAPGPEVLAQGDGAGAGGAADAGVELVVQGVVGDAVLLEVGPGFPLAPLGERVEFLQPVAFVVFL